MLQKQQIEKETIKGKYYRPPRQDEFNSTREVDLH